ncbi:MAG: aspartate aminotransferase family protein [Proteobacteria bacterium]|jgi:putrescine aminotransferase|nr:aspartate aminotransferase family protein [Pseudomonadota bacterium]MBT4106554.1 aspartate aminotransferase family protein [Pseudomonadota bacterium]MBT4357515.1 aspartate aminotransferase family protein [Pseudomonadota bacterium]MBT4988586.1 aspartate aminotransferase family protein [Pseudomonadota bacterium]MBT5189380.1 aspartate aminotransferase family protein [Pseudomonadota bacterium]
MALSTAEYRALDSAHFLHPFTDHKELHQKGSRIIERADGVYLFDSEGNRLLDAMAGLWCVNVGYGRKDLAAVAQKQMEQLPYYNSFFQTAHPPVIELSKLLSEVTPDHLNYVFLTNSGSESNDTVVRMVRHYWTSLGHPEKQTIISRKNAYHGSTVAGASLGGMSAMHAQGGLIPGVEHINQPYWYREGGDLSPEAFGKKIALELEHKIESLGEHQVAAFIAEPIQGAGGVIVPPETYWPTIKEICDRHQILLVADEVICGFGRTGQWFGSDYYDLKPDLMPIAKGLSSGYLPIGGVMVADHVSRVVIEEGGEFFHGMTYAGHPAACAVASANIRILRDEGIIENVRDQTAPYLQKRWKELAEHPLVGEVRGLGFLGAMELVADKASGKQFEPGAGVGGICRDLSAQAGLVMRAVGDTMIISPPLIMTHEQIDELVTLAHQALDQTLAAIKKSL